MHIITRCAKCDDDFMYHTTDSNLIRDLTFVDEVGNNTIEQVVICQDCDLKDRWVGKKVKVSSESPYEHLNKYELIVEDVDRNNQDFPIVVKIGDFDSHEWFLPNELEVIY